MGHAAGMAPEQFEPLRELIVVLLRFVAVYCLFDAMNVVFMSAIRGAGDTRFVFWTSLGTSLLPLSLAWLGIHHLGQGLLWCWTLITLWVCSAGLIYLGALPARQVADDAGDRAGGCHTPQPRSGATRAPWNNGQIELAAPFGAKTNQPPPRFRPIFSTSANSRRAAPVQETEADQPEAEPA